MQPQGNLATELFKRMQRKNLIEPRVPATYVHHALSRSRSLILAHSAVARSLQPRTPLSQEAQGALLGARLKLPCAVSVVLRLSHTHCRAHAALLGSSSRPACSLARSFVPHTVLIRLRNNNRERTATSTGSATSRSHSAHPAGRCYIYKSNIKQNQTKPNSTATAGARQQRRQHAAGVRGALGACASPATAATT